jgi:hypothetical protein
MIVFKQKGFYGPQLLTENVKIHFEQRFDLLQRNFCTCESLGYPYEWQKPLKEKRRTYANESA